MNKTSTPALFIGALLLMIDSATCGKQDAVSLSDTLAWIDNTYNPHQNVSGGYGHGTTGIYDLSERLVKGGTETFFSSGCQIVLNFEEDRTSSTSNERYDSSSTTFNLRDVDPRSIRISTYQRHGGGSCDGYGPEERQRYGMDCDHHSEIVFSTRTEGPLISEETHSIYPNLKGSEHDAKSKSKASKAFFEVDDVEYAPRLAKAFRHAVELCGGKPSGF